MHSIDEYDLRRLAHPARSTAEVIVRQDKWLTEDTYNSRLIFIFTCPKKFRKGDRGGCKKGV